MKQPDDYYLQDHTIVTIFEKGDIAMVSHVFACIERKFKSSFFKRRVLFNHYLLSREQLVAIADESFNEMQRIFYDRVLAGDYEVRESGLTSFLYKIFCNQYQNAYRKEMVHRKHLTLQTRPAGSARMSDDMPAINKPEGIYKMMLLAISKLTPDCRKLIVLKDLQVTNNEDIQAITQLKNMRSVHQQTFRCREQLKRILSQEFGIEA